MSFTATDHPAAVDSSFAGSPVSVRRRVDRTPQADAVLVALLVLAACEPAHTPLRWITGEDSGRWLFLVPLWTCAALIGLTDGRGLRAASRAPAGWLLAAMVWAMLMSPFGGVPHLDLVTAAGLTAFVLAGSAIVESGGWAAMRAAVFPASAILLVASALTEFSSASGERWVGVFRDANALGFGCVIAAISGVDRWTRGGRGGLLLAWAAVPPLLLSDGRVAMAALVVSIIAMMWSAVPRGLLLAAVAAVMVCGAWLVADGASRDSLSRQISRSGDLEEITTLTGRTGIWDIAVEEIGQHPMAGIGAGSTPELFLTEGRDGRTDFGGVVHGHNLWVQLGLHGGAPAIVFVAVGSIAFCVSGLRRPVRDRNAMMLAILVHGLTEDVIAEPRYTLILVAAAFASASRRSRSADGAAAVLGRRSV